MNVIYAEDLPEDQRPPVMGDWVAVAEPHGMNYLIAVHWERGKPAPHTTNYLRLIRQVRARIATAVQEDNAPVMPFYWRVGGAWVGVVDPEAADWSPDIAYNALDV